MWSSGATTKKEHLPFTRMSVFHCISAISISPLAELPFSRWKDGCTDGIEEVFSFDMDKVAEAGHVEASDRTGMAIEEPSRGSWEQGWTNFDAFLVNVFPFKHGSTTIAFLLVYLSRLD